MTLYKQTVVIVNVFSIKIFIYQMIAKYFIKFPRMSTLRRRLRITLVYVPECQLQGEDGKVNGFRTQANLPSYRYTNDAIGFSPTVIR